MVARDQSVINPRRSEIRRRTENRLSPGETFGAGEGTRTPDLPLTRRLLYRLSYSSAAAQGSALARSTDPGTGQGPFAVTRLPAVLLGRPAVVGLVALPASADLAVLLRSEHAVRATERLGTRVPRMLRP
jgi:hypothetical protein